MRYRASFLAYAFWVHKNATPKNWLMSAAYQGKIIAFVIDEAHCVNFWLVSSCLSSYNYYRGDEFRKRFAEIGSITGLLPSKVSVLALTATGIQQTLKCVISHTAMQDPYIIGLPPDRPNIRLSVQPCPRIPMASKGIARKRHTAVVFCRSLCHCANMCIMIRNC